MDGYGWIWISLNRFPLKISWLLCIQNQCVWLLMTKGLLMMDVLHCAGNGSLCWQNFIHPLQSPCWFQVSSMFIYCFCLPYLFICYHLSLPGFTRFYQVLPGFTRFYQVLPGFTRFYHEYLTYFTQDIQEKIFPCWSSGLRDDFVHLHWDQRRKRPLLAPLRWGFRRSGFQGGRSGAWDCWFRYVGITWGLPSGGFNGGLMGFNQQNGGFNGITLWWTKYLGKPMGKWWFNHYKWWFYGGLMVI